MSRVRRAQKRQDAVQNEARLEKEAADECRMKEVVRDVTQRVAEGKMYARWLANARAQ